MSCIAVPISWPRLERYAAGSLDAQSAAAVAEHLGACATCRSCFERLRADELVLPALPITAAPPERRRWLSWSAGLGLAVATVVVLVLVVRVPVPRPEGAGLRAHVKGAGEVVLSVVRERDGAIAYAPTTFRTEDRWKLRVTCAPGASVWADVVVLQGEEPAAFPLVASPIVCGNDVTLPGAFRLTGTAPARLCVALASGAPPDRSAVAAAGGGGGDIACAVIVPED